MLKRLIILLLLASWAVLARAQALPEVKLQDASGRTVMTSALADGKTPFVVSMWMTTCKPCLKELDTLAEELVDWNEPFALKIYAVSIDDSRSLQRAIAMSGGRDWDGISVLFDPNGDLRRALNVSAVPQVFVYDGRGDLFYTHIGYRPGDELELLEQVKKCAKKK
jgi:peroxiredoxin